uniref:Zinc finger CCHC domain-containing protein 17 n=1 Tax=Salvator merianae TaxID=96440 RepID=A0A8D0B6K0_SALMN
MEVIPELYDIFQGEVASVTEYGVFIKIPGTRKQGLVHKSQMSNCRVDRPSEMVDVGEKVWVKLIGKEKQDDKLKLSLSMKVVSQGTGKDLDPNNVALDQDARRKCSFKDYTSQKIKLEAVLNTVCKKCDCPGHFAKDCFMQPGGTKYTLLPEEDVVPAGVGGKSQQPEDHSKKRKKEKKKKKKLKRKKPSGLDDSDSGDSDVGSVQPARKKAKPTEKVKTDQKKKKKKHHKKKHKE